MSVGGALFWVKNVPVTQKQSLKKLSTSRFFSIFRTRLKSTSVFGLERLHNVKKKLRN